MKGFQILLELIFNILQTPAYFTCQVSWTIHATRMCVITSLVIICLFWLPKIFRKVMRSASATTWTLPTTSIPDTKRSWTSDSHAHATTAKWKEKFKNSKDLYQSAGNSSINRPVTSLNQLMKLFQNMVGPKL